MGKIVKYYCDNCNEEISNLPIYQINKLRLEVFNPLCMVMPEANDVIKTDLYYCKACIKIIQKKLGVIENDS
jgi:hypothetical protein